MNLPTSFHWRPKWSRRGQFMPLTAFILLATTVFTMAVVDVYRVSKAKLEAQGMADAAALAITSLEARCINTVIDRDEWLNHMYSGTNTNKDRIPNLSEAAILSSNGSPFHFPGAKQSDYAQAFAQIVATVNREQQLYEAAYNNFIGAGNGTTSNNSGVGSLDEILREIHGFNDPRVFVYVWNTQKGAQDAENRVNQVSGQGGGAGGSGTSNIQGAMEALPFETHEIRVQTEGNGVETLSDAFNKGGSFKVGWREPKWEQADFPVKGNKSGASDPSFGAGVYVVKSVRLMLLPGIYVKARSTAYVVKGSGISRDPATANLAWDQIKAPTHFRPTYFVQLGAKQ